MAERPISLMEDTGTQELAAWGRLREWLDSFLFFHLGSDAALQVEESASGIRFEIVHARVETIRFEIARDRVGELVKDETALEDFMLELLTRHRRHARS